MTDRDFYEEDEPVEDVIRAFDAGEHGVTSWPQPTFTYIASESENTAPNSFSFVRWVSSDNGSAVAAR